MTVKLSVLPCKFSGFEGADDVVTILGDMFQPYHRVAGDDRGKTVFYIRKS